MKVKFRQPKGGRIKKGTYRAYVDCRRPIFMGLTTYYQLLWHEDLKRWVDPEDYVLDYLVCRDTNYSIHSLKSAIRHINKHKHYLPKGTVFTLQSWYVGYDIEITV